MNNFARRLEFQVLAAILFFAAAAVVMHAQSAATTTLVKSRVQVIDSFDGASLYSDNGKQIQWKARGSRLKTATFPRLTYVPGWPQRLFGVNPPNKASLQTLALWGKFTDKGYNTMEAVPGYVDQNGKWTAHALPLTGNPVRVVLWVWGIGDNGAKLRAVFTDATGMIQTVYAVQTPTKDDPAPDLGDISYTGWRQVSFMIPKNFKRPTDASPYTPRVRLAKLVVETIPTTDPRNLRYFFDQMTSYYIPVVSNFDGSDLSQNSAKVKQAWADANGSAPTATDAQAQPAGANGAAANADAPAVAPAAAPGNGANVAPAAANQG